MVITRGGQVMLDESAAVKRRRGDQQPSAAAATLTGRPWWRPVWRFERLPAAGQPGRDSPWPARVSVIWGSGIEPLTCDFALKDGLSPLFGVVT
jgi:hypothetical protein